MGRNDRDEWIVMPLGQPHHDKDQDGQQDEELQRGGELAYHLNSAHVDVGDDRDHDEVRRHNEGE